jgi:cell wall-associated NlpC family hydrolase
MVGEKVERDDIRVGDVVYFKGSNHKSKHVGHVGIVVQIDGDDIIFIHASIHRGICFDHVQSSYYQKRFLGARRFLGK